MSSAIDIADINEVNDTQVQECRSVRQQGTRSTTDNSEDPTIVEQFVGTKMDQD